MHFTRSLAAAAVLAASTLGAAAAERTVTIGTGGETGVYFVVGQSIAKLVNAGTAAHGLRVEAPSTAGSIANISAVAAGEIEMGIAQSDWQFHAYNGTSQFEGKQVGDLRAMFSVHAEPFTIVARQGTGIETFDDLRGRRVNVGNPGSGQYATMQVVLAAKGWTLGDFALASELPPAEQSAALCAGEVEAIVYTVGHPNGSIHEATAFCDSQLVPVTGAGIDTLVDANPFYAHAMVPRGLYASGNEQDTPTFGVRATVVTSAAVPDDVVYGIVKAVFDGFPAFRKMHPAFETLEPEAMLRDGLSAPLHPGALRYYRERGWAE
jgi:TRAP transporter TAXI family solute receptor